jgi:hypothetical protein
MAASGPPPVSRRIPAGVTFTSEPDGFTLRAGGDPKRALPPAIVLVIVLCGLAWPVVDMVEGTGDASLRLLGLLAVAGAGAATFGWRILRIGLGRLEVVVASGRVRVAAGLWPVRSPREFAAEAVEDVLLEDLPLFWLPQPRGPHVVLLGEDLQVELGGFLTMDAARWCRDRLRERLVQEPGSPRY